VLSDGPGQTERVLDHDDPRAGTGLGRDGEVGLERGAVRGRDGRIGHDHFIAEDAAA
jgi:hypothetical protein